MWILSEWLSHLELDKYYDIFVQNDITEVKICRQLDDNFLIAMGVQNEKDRKLILQNLPIYEELVDEQMYVVPPPPSSESEEENIYVNSNNTSKDDFKSFKGSIKKRPIPTPRRSKSKTSTPNTPTNFNKPNFEAAMNSDTENPEALYSSPGLPPPRQNNCIFLQSGDIYTTYILDKSTNSNNDSNLSLVVNPPDEEESEVNDNAKNEQIYSAVVGQVQMRKKASVRAEDQIKSILGPAPELPPKISGDLIKLQDFRSPSNSSTLSSPNMPEPPYPPPELPENFHVTDTIPLPIETYKNNDSTDDSDGYSSDGGDFLDDISLTLNTSLPNTLPVMTPYIEGIHRADELFKVSSSSSGGRARSLLKHNSGRKRWVTLDCKYLKYYSLKDKRMPRRIIPLNSIKYENFESLPSAIDGDIYYFSFQTVDRSYTFGAAGSLKGRQIRDFWITDLGRILEEYKRQGWGPWVSGGEMRNGQKYGFARLESIFSGKKYLVLKKTTFAFYNSEIDYKAGSPINLMDMKLVSTKQTSNKLHLRSPECGELIFSFDDAAECESWNKALMNATSDALSNMDENTGTANVDINVIIACSIIHKSGGNDICADCGSINPEWASINLGITICLDCSGSHRHLGSHISKVKALNLDKYVWSSNVIGLFERIGNNYSNNFLEANLPTDIKLMFKFSGDLTYEKRQQFITDKYAHKLYIPSDYKNISNLNELLCESVQTRDVGQTFKLILSGADLNYHCKSGEFQGKTALEISQLCHQPLQEQDAEHASEINITRKKIVCQGTLYKIFPGAKSIQDCPKRWCNILNDIFSVYENEGGNLKEQFSVSKIIALGRSNLFKSDRCETFIVHMDSDKFYVYGAECEDDYRLWVQAFAQSIGPTAIHNKLFDFAGQAYAHKGVNEDWKMYWLQVCNKELFICDYGSDPILDKFNLLQTKSLVNHLPSAENKINQCGGVFKNGSHIVLDLPEIAIYIQGNTPEVTIAWYDYLKSCLEVDSKALLEEHLQTSDNVPLIVEKCINFISAYGLEMEGIYRHTGSIKQVDELYKQFCKDATTVHLRHESSEDCNLVVSCLKKFLRSLPISLIFFETDEVLKILERPDKLNGYKELIAKLPIVHRSTLKKFMQHLNEVARYDNINKMNIENLSTAISVSLFDHTALLNDKIMKFTADLIGNFNVLFDVDLEKFEAQQRQIEAAKRKMQFAASSEGVVNTLDIKVSIKVLKNKEPDARGQFSMEDIALNIHSKTTAGEILANVKRKLALTNDIQWGLYYIVCNGELDYFFHSTEEVYNFLINSWPDEFNKNTYICVKENYSYQRMPKRRNETGLKYLSAEGLLYSDERNKYKHSAVELRNYNLVITKQKANESLEIPVEQLMIFVGLEYNRTPPREDYDTIRYRSLTFLNKLDKNPTFKPFFGNTVIFATEEDLFSWLSEIFNIQYSDALEHNVTRKDCKISLGIDAQGKVKPKLYSSPKCKFPELAKHNNKKNNQAMIQFCKPVFLTQFKASFEDDF
ncbi:DgyrCDS3621 [Dimorphilus gyrociliatus]|uniref:DgyrCDS3621 n=1 Tax=Dimorphilus gyrociliatus TaxID=2664684 RepID=A0A7I8VGV5_9ANNE|nr:DgyrCDS3621 [Dimorphilus gyrociliatus]